MTFDVVFDVGPDLTAPILGMDFAVMIVAREPHFDRLWSRILDLDTDASIRIRR